MKIDEGIGFIELHECYKRSADGFSAYGSLG